MSAMMELDLHTLRENPTWLAVLYAYQTAIEELAAAVDLGADGYFVVVIKATNAPTQKDFTKVKVSHFPLRGDFCSKQRSTNG